MALLRNRDFILFLALVLGLAWGTGAQWTRSLTLPALAVAMTLSTTAIGGRVFRDPRKLVVPALAGIMLNFVVLTGALLLLGAVLIREPDFWTGFVILAAVPPAVAVIPFTGFLDGNLEFSLLGSLGAYLGALIITPLVTLGLLGTAFIDPVKLVIIVVELIIVPLIASRVLLWTGASGRLAPVKGTAVNWCFFLVVYTIVGLNRAIFLRSPLSLVPVALIAVASTFLLGFAIERVALWRGVPHETATSLVMLGTLKNYGLAAGVALALVGGRTAVPATVASVFLIVYIIWLGWRKKRCRRRDDRDTGSAQ
jgi:BASS family bile acid:Na+ symporter